MKRVVKWMLALGVLSTLAGCTNGLYASRVSAVPAAGGQREFLEVSSLENLDCSPVMPVVVTVHPDTSRPRRASSDLNELLWFFSVGLVPLMESQTSTVRVTVRTPLGTREGSYELETDTWTGWVPIFCPYPGWADVRFAQAHGLLPYPAQDDQTRERLEKKVRGRLVSGLVGQFPKARYDAFVKEHSPVDLWNEAK